MQSISIPSETELVHWINNALKQCGNVLSLARTELAFSPLITPLLVLDEQSPTADERGHAVHLLLRWAVERLAPEASSYPLATIRPFDDPTWRDPRWWGYNILRHRYLEPLHPDDFVEGGRFTETLMALTGIPSEDTFFEERNRALRSAAHRLFRQAQDGSANEELRQQALNGIYQPLQTQANLRQSLEIASVFEEVFPRMMLLDLAQREQISAVENALEQLIAKRYLLDASGSLWMSPVLSKFVYARQNTDRMLLRHRRVAELYRKANKPLLAIIHLQRARQWNEAATMVLDSAKDLSDELQLIEIIGVLERFKANHLTKEQWHDIQILLADLSSKNGDNDRAIEACRQALKTSLATIQQAQVYRRLGKLYEKRNQRTALGYYQQAIERFNASDPEYLDVLKDRAWLFILRRQWNEAEVDLTLALHHATESEHAIRADIYDALASLYRNQKLYTLSIDYAQKSLSLRELLGNKLQIAKSFNNLGNLYDALGDIPSAISAFQEAIQTAHKLGNQALLAEALLNLGATYFVSGRVSESIQNYQQSLTMSQHMGLLMIEINAHYNLAEAFATIGQIVEARQHWHTGIMLSKQAGFDDRLAYSREVLAQFPMLGLTERELPNQLVQIPRASAYTTSTTFPDQSAILDLLQSQGQITARTLIDALHISKATATRKLANLVNDGTLERHGEGRGVYYTLPRPQTHAYALASPTTLHLQRQLETLLPNLRDDYQIECLSPMLDSTRGDLLVTFTKEPDLPTFFRLERKLSAALGISINLVLPFSD